MLWFYSHQLIMSVNNSYIKCRLGRHIFAPIVIHSCVTLVSHCFVICTLLHLPSQVYTCPVRHSSVTEPAPPDRNVWCGGDQVLSVARWNVDPSLSMRLFSSNQLIRCNVYNALVGSECQHFTALSSLTGTKVRNNYKSHITSQL